MHGSYGMLWVAKVRFFSRPVSPIEWGNSRESMYRLWQDIIFPDPKWQQHQTLGSAIMSFSWLCLYWVAPYLLISQQ